MNTPKNSINKTLPVLAVRDIVVYPHAQVAIVVGRMASINAILQSQKKDGQILLVSQKDSLQEDIDTDNLNGIGVVCKIINTMAHEGDAKHLKILLEGETRVQITNLTLRRTASNKEDDGLSDVYNEYYVAKFNTKDLSEDIEDEYKRHEDLLQLFEEYSNQNLKNSREIMAVASKLNSLPKLMYFIATRLALPLDEKLSLLDIEDGTKLYEAIFLQLLTKKAVHALEHKISEQVREQMENNQREYYLNEKLKVIKSELANYNEAYDDDDDALLERIEEAKLPEEVYKKSLSEFKKLKMMPASSSEASVVRSYLEWILDTPWTKSSKSKIELKKSRQILDKEHFGLQDVKDRVLEYLAVQARTKKPKGPILCLVGPPGVGKTSLGQSIARAVGRKYVRMALGGVHDEAEIRGHRRTYIGAMPGKIVQSLSKVEVNNPLFLLDEIDKIAKDFRGDPASALLEVLDPAQNKAFNDHYLDLDLDLSNVMFLCTANSMDIPAPLLDRMEIIRLPGYTEDEKSAIAQNHLLPKALKDNGLKSDEIEIAPDAIMSIIRHYTREAGVRNLERQLHKILRKSVRRLGEDKTLKHINVTKNNIDDFLGVAPFDYGLAEEEAQIGRITGLAWTSVGGELLDIEVALMHGKGELSFTGSLGDVMKESIKAAMSVVRVNADRFGIDPEMFKTHDVHVHLPEGATPKDGPSAGIALTCALTSAFTGIAISPDIAMTGEVTLRGKVLKIGGLKEKLLAAHRGGIKRVLIPKANVPDLADIKDEYKDGLQISAVSDIAEVLLHALVSPIGKLKSASKTKNN